jgi:2-phosphoglycerate kinase
MSVAFDWKVLLIGGHSGTGKTTAARVLAQDFGVALAQVDDFRLVLEQTSTPEQQPTLHTLMDVQAADAAPETRCAALIAAAQTVSQALEVVVAHHVATDRPTILEGDGITPAFAAKRFFFNLDVPEGAVRAVFLIEDDESHLLRNALERGRGFETLPRARQQRQIRQSWLYGQWLKSEALGYNLPVVASQPWETLPERILKILRATT